MHIAQCKNQCPAEAKESEISTTVWAYAAPAKPFLPYRGHKAFCETTASFLAQPKTYMLPDLNARNPKVTVKLESATAIRVRGFHTCPGTRTMCPKCHFSSILNHQFRPNF